MIWLLSLALLGMGSPPLGVAEQPMCRLESEERLSTTTKACRYSCSAGTDYIITVKGFCPRYVRYGSHS